MSQIGGIPGERLFKMEGRFEHLAVPLVENPDPRIRIRMIALRLNGRGEYLFDIDSASADFLTISPLLAEELGLALTGSSTASGVGSGEASVRFSLLDKVELGGIVFRNVPVMVSDIHPFKGLKKGPARHGPAQAVQRHDRCRAEGHGPLSARTAGPPRRAHRPVGRGRGRPALSLRRDGRRSAKWPAPRRLSTSWTRRRPPTSWTKASSGSHLKPNIEPARIVRSGIQGAQGAQYVNRVDGLPVSLGPLVFEEQTFHEFPMGVLNEIGGRYLAGLVGNPLLWPYRVHMDFNGGRLILEKRAGS